MGIKSSYNIKRTGDNVSELLDKIEAMPDPHDVKCAIPKANFAYQKPPGGIPTSDLSFHVNQSLNKANTAYQKPSTGIPKEDLSAGVQASLDKADTALQSFTEVDPTVPSWAKQSNKPTYTASEVGALPDDTFIPSALSELSDDSTHRTVTDAEKDAWNSKYSIPTGGIPASDLANGVIPDVSQFITKTVSDLVNYYTKSETYTKQEVQTLIAGIPGFTYELASSLPAASATTMWKMYLIPSSDPQLQNVKDEFITVDNGLSANPRYTWEQIGSTAVDLSDYVTSDALATALAGLNDVKYTSQSLTDAQKAQARTNIGATAPEAFVATYGTTTYAEVAAAISDGKVVVVKRVIDEGTADEGVTFYGNLEELFGIYFFSCILFSLEGAATEIIAVDGTGWNSVGIEYLEDVARKVSSWSAVPSDLNYPSEKLVKDSLDGKQPTIDAQHKLDYSLIANTPTIPVLESMTTSEVTGAVNTAWDNVMNA